MRIDTMKYLPISKMLAAMFVLALMLPLNALADDEGDSFDEATDLQLSTPFYGAIDEEGDTDFFSFTLEFSATVTFWTTGEIDTYPELYDVDEDLIDVSRFGAENGNFVIQISLSAGTYNLAVSGERGAVGDYELNASISSTPDITLSVDAGSDDYSVNESIVFSEINAELGFMDVPDFTQLSYVWTQLSGSEVTFVDSTNSQLSFTAPALPEKESELLVFQVTVTDPATGAEASDTVDIYLQDLPNELPSNEELAFDKTVEAYIYVFDVTGSSPNSSYDRDIDYHKIEFDNDASLGISVTTEIPLVVSLINSSGTTIVSESIRFSGDFILTEKFLVAGTYYLKVSSLSGYEFLSLPGGNYSLTATQGDPILNSGDIDVSITANFPDLTTGQSFYGVGLDVHWTFSATVGQDNYGLCNTVSGSSFDATSSYFIENYTRQVKDGCEYDITLQIESLTGTDTDLDGSFSASVDSDGNVTLTQISGENDGLSVFNDQVIFGGGVTFDFGTMSLLVSEQISDSESEPADYSLLSLSYESENYPEISASGIQGSSIQNGDYISIPLPTVSGGYEYSLTYSISGKIFHDIYGTFSLSNESSDYINDELTFVPNQSPIANAGEDQSVNRGDLVTLNASQSVDVDGALLSYTWLQLGEQTVTLNNADTANANFISPIINTPSLLSFEVTVMDDLGSVSSDTVQVTVNHTNLAPVVMDFLVSTTEDVASNIELLATDNDDDTLTFSVVQSPSSGTLSSLDGNKTVYTPDQDFFGSDSFSYRVNDGIADSNLANVTIEVSSVNDVPIITSDPVENARETKLYRYELTATDVDSETLNYSALTIPSWLSLVDGVLSGTPLEADVGEHVVVLQVSDEESPAETATQSFNIVVIDFEEIALQITAPPDIVLEASSLLTEVELGEPEIEAEEDSQVTVSVDQTGPFAVGEYLLVWSATEEGSNTVTATQKVTIEDTTAPLIETPDLIEIDATGEFTDITSNIDFSATDLVDGIVEIELVSDNIQQSGLQQIAVSATDSHGNQAEQLVQVAIHPQLMLGIDKVAEKSADVVIPIQLSGAAAIFPVKISYQIDEAGQLVDGEFLVESEDIESLVITLSDGLFAGDQVIVTLTSVQNAVLSSDKQLVITIIDTNYAPTLKVDLYQDEMSASIVDQTNGSIELKASVFDSNLDDVHDILWLDSDSNELGNGATLTLDPLDLTVGKYSVMVKVSETNTNEAYSNVVEKVFWVVDSLPLLTEADTDGDGISDIDEGYTDSDSDGIPDFKDTNYSENELPVLSGIRKLQASVGIQLGLGESVQQQAGGLGDSAGLTQEELINLYGTLAIDEEFDFAFPLIDFVANSLDQQGDSLTLLIALEDGSALPENASYRKFSIDTGWREFVSDAANSIASALTDAQGNCPSFDSELYIEGLTAGDQCVVLTIQDGSANDDDALTNAVVVDPGAIVVEVPNLAPQIVVSGDESVNEGQVLTLNASATNDPEGKPLTYVWQQLTGPAVILEGDNSSVLNLTAPNLDADEQIELQLTVSDGKNSSVWTKVILITFVNQLPELTVSASSSSVLEKESVTLTATATDADGQNLSYVWEQISGPNVNLGSADTAQLTIIMPEVDSNSKLVFKITVFDGNDTVTQYMNLIVVNKEGGGINPLTLLLLILAWSLALVFQTRKSTNY